MTPPTCCRVGTARAVNIPRRGAIDHVVSMTMSMTHAVPKISNLILNGIFDRCGPVEYGMFHPPMTDANG